MQHDPLMEHQLEAQTSQLGALEAQYVLDPRKLFARFGLLLVFALLAPLGLFGLSRERAPVLPAIIFSVLFFCLVGGAALLGFARAYRSLQVSVYTNGLLYRNGARRRVVSWSQIVNVSRTRG